MYLIVKLIKFQKLLFHQLEQKAIIQITTAILMLHLETKRLKYRQWQESDYETVAEFYSHEENARCVGGIKTPEEAWRLLSTYIGQYHLRGYSYCALIEKESEQLVGTVGLYHSPNWPEPELGYWLLPEAQGKGYAIEAGMAVRDYALNDLNFKSLVSYIDSKNEPSKKLALKLGAEFDKVIPLLEYGDHEVYRYR